MREYLPDALVTSPSHEAQWPVSIIAYCTVSGGTSEHCVIKLNPSTYFEQVRLARPSHWVAIVNLGLK
jgi:hypothetical protein